MSHEIQALKNRIKRSESDIVKLRSEYQELLDRMTRLEGKSKMKMPSKKHNPVRFEVK